MSNPGPSRPSTSSGRKTTLPVPESQKVTGDRPAPPKGQSTVPPPLGPTCLKCGRSYQTRSGLLKHSKTCGTRDRTACQFCGKQFDSFPGVRLHERAAHRALYDRELESSLTVPDAVTYRVMADIEASTKKGAPFINEMVSATGLTKDQVRHRRAKPVYKEYLQEATNKRRRLSTGGSFLSARGAHRPSPIATPGIPSKAPTPSGPPAPQDAGAGPSSILTIDASPPPSRGVAVSASPRPPPAEPPPAPTPATSVSLGPSTPLTPSLNKRKRTACSPDSPGQPAADVTPNSPRDEPQLPISSSPGPHFSQVAGPSGYVAPSLPGKKRSHQSCSTSSSDTTPPHANPARRPRTHGPCPSASPLSTTSSRPSRPHFTDGRPPLAFHSSQHLSLLDLRELDVPNVRNDLFVEAFFDLRTRIPETRGIVLNTISAALAGQPADLLATLDAWMVSLAPRRPQRASRPSTNGPRNYGQSTGGRGPKASAFKKAQDLYGKNRSALADSIINATDLLAPDVTPPMADIEAVYGPIFESPSPPDDEPTTNLPPLFMSHPISSDELHRAITSWRPSAPGVDGIRVQDVKSSNRDELLVLLNAVLFRNVIPTTWRSLKTTLVPKGGDRRNPSNWRPITVSSALQRLLHRILAHRLSSNVELHSSQRGFVNIDGTMANSLILDTYIRQRVERGSTYNIISLDLQKAFDSVSHNSILRAMRRAGLDPHTIEYISNSLQDNFTTLKVGLQTSRPIRLRRGVKQGDPLSPFLFNLVVDELLASLNRPGLGGTLCEGVNISAIAFADDLVLLADSDVSVPPTLAQVEAFFSARGMLINPRKSFAISCATKDHKSVPRSRPVFKVGDSWIPAVTATNSFKYLGHQVSSSGIGRPSLANLPSWLSNLHRAPLKPDQRLCLLRQYVIPKLLYGLQNPKVTGRMLRDADRLIKACTKKILHISPHTPDQFLYASVRDGGLGIMELRYEIPRIFLGRLTKLLDMTTDVSLRYVMQSPSVQALLARLSRLSGPIPASQKWRQAITNGPTSSGLEDADHYPASRNWLHNKPNGWTGRDFVRAVQLRTGNLPTAGLPYNPAEQRRCRAGCNKIESISHVLQGCPATHWERIRRHNEIAKKLAGHCRARWAIEEEPHVRHANGQLFKPDLAIHLNDANHTVVITDVQVSWEGTLGLASSWDAKRRVYDNPSFREAAARRWPTSTLLFLPLVIGARGILHRVNEATLTTLKIPDPLRSSLVQSVLKWGSSIHSAFGRKVFRRR